VSTTRVTLAETPPAGFGNPRWSQLRQTLKCLDSAIRKTSVTLTDIVEATGNVKPVPLVAPPLPARFRTAVGSYDYVQVQFGPIPAELSYVTANFPYSSTAFGTEVDSPYRETVCALTFGAAAVGDSSDITFDLHTAIPRGFTGWGTESIVFNYGISITGLGGGSEGVVSLYAYNAATGAVLGSVTQGYSESGGAITAAYPTKIAANRESMGTDWREGVTLRFALAFNFPNTHSGGAVKVGPVRINWE